jgi:hypothetical protein
MHLGTARAVSFSADPATGEPPLPARFDYDLRCERTIAAAESMPAIRSPCTM